MVGYWDRELRNRLANDAYVGWVGRTPEQARGLHMRDVVGEDAYRENLPYIAGVLQALYRAKQCGRNSTVRYRSGT
ncbi:PAS domain-containing protein [Arthrobacter sp. ISL-5]|nr:PAS domain-containing protein [Arthrobacter sp. ISL-5]